ncbi:MULTISPECIES: hypothetical protein [unclassified Nostoc]|uniref:hypothetical protein n=1 Tax=unclassified Nostoc TaxID=2593658 RepID=UPI001C898800|nr:MULTISPECIES: hypothetical protein [unclassified Nostoc]
MPVYRSQQLCLPVQKKIIARNLIHRLPLRSLLIVPFVLQIFAAVGLTGYISLRNGQKAVNDVSGQLCQEMSDRLNLQVWTIWKDLM